MPKQKHHTPTFKVQVTLEMIKEEETVAQIAAEHAIRPRQLRRRKRHVLEHFPQLFTESQALQSQAHAHDEQVTALYAEIDKLTTQVEWLKNLASTLSRTERQALLDGGPDALPLTTQTALLSLYCRPVEVTLNHRFDEMRGCPRIGYGRYYGGVARRSWCPWSHSCLLAYNM